MVRKPRNQQLEKYAVEYIYTDIDVTSNVPYTSHNLSLESY